MAHPSAHKRPNMKLFNASSGHDEWKNEVHRLKRSLGVLDGSDFPFIEFSKRSIRYFPHDVQG